MAGLEYRPVIQTRHTFATMMVSSGENLGWIQKMMGHSSLKMITDKYFSYIPNMTHYDGSKFMEEYKKKGEKRAPNEPHSGFFSPKLLILMVEAGGVEPPSENIPLRHLHA